ncbi:MAG TPA: glycosyltransferase family 39 protein [Candidatus Binatia bacterium]|nr:glycosyltransferase family 39 protein [Candidatus Binatia bacterium]
MGQVTFKSTRPFSEPETASILHLIFLIGLCGILYFPYLNATPFFDKGEPREALAVQDIVQRGEWLVPLKRATDIPSKPPLFHWSAALVTTVTGALNEATIRFPSALYATLGVLLVYWLGRKIYDAKTALLGAAILATMIVYQDQALSARVDMTLCFFVTLSLVLFYALYRGYLTSALWFYLFFAVLGVGTLAKGPLGLLLPGLVAGSFALLERRWDMIKKFTLHPGVILALVLATGWYVVAVTRGGEGFLDRQILQENLSRLVGGSGHSHPIYYYIPYLFSQALPWGLFLPLMLWDLFKTGLRTGDDRLFLKLWFAVMFVFFSVAAGKRAVYLLPLYPAVSLLLAGWFFDSRGTSRRRLLIYRGGAIFAALTGVLLVVIAMGAIWSHDQAWFFAPIEALLKDKDRANLVAVRTQLDDFGWTFTLVLVVIAILWLSLARSLWSGRMFSAAYQLVAVSVLQGWISWSVVMPAIAQEKSYRDFMSEVNGWIKPGDQIFTYGEINSDAIVFYGGQAIDKLNLPPEALATKIGKGDSYLILEERNWKEIQQVAGDLPPPLARSEGKGPEGDQPLVLVRADLSQFGALKNPSLSNPPRMRL